MTHTRQTCGAWIWFLQRIYDEKVRLDEKKIGRDGEIEEKVEEKEGEMM